MMDGNYIEATRFNERQHRFISAVLISLMMAAVGLTIAQVGNQIVPTWQGTYLIIIGLLISLERFYTLRAIKKMSVLSREWVVALSTQWVVNLIIIKLIVSFSSGFNTLIAEVSQWQRSFATEFFTPGFILAAVFAALVWVYAGILVELLDEMGLDTSLIVRESLASAVRDQTPPRQRLMAAVFGLGAVLMFITAVARVDLRAFFSSNSVAVSHSMSPLEAGGLGTLLYFLFALVLLSKGNYITLNTRWFLQHLPVNRTMATRWAIYSLAFLALIVLVASVLPTSYSLGFLSLLGYLIDIFFMLLALLFGLIYALIGFLVSLPFLLFQQDAPTNLPVTTPTPPLPPPPELLEPNTPVPWLELLKSAIFWLIFIGVVGYSIKQYLRQHEEIVVALRKFPGWKFLSGLWAWISGWFGNINRGVGRMLDAGRSRLRPDGESGKPSRLGGFFRFRRLSTRQKIYFYYHALLHRGNETGLPRQPFQTPEEYAQIIEHSVPTAETEIDALTEAFYSARYSRHPVEEQEVSKVKTYWEQIRRVVRGRRG